MEYAATSAAAAPRPSPDPNTPCTLSLFCDLSQSRDTVNGLFAANASANPSMVWQIIVNGQPTAISDDDLVIPRNGNNSVQVTITFNLNGGRFIDLPGLAGRSSDGNETLTSSAVRLSIIVARNRRKTSTATFGSPFALSGTGACTVFDAVAAASALNIQKTPAFTFDLGTPVLNSGSAPGNRDSYMFLVAITGFVLQSNGTTLLFTDSHDPEMEIGL